MDRPSPPNDDLCAQRAQFILSGSRHDADYEGEETSGDEGWEEEL